MSDDKKPMQSRVNLDSVEFKCPCGDSIEGEGEMIRRFLDNHWAHTNDWVEEFITDDGMRIMSSDTPRNSTWRLSELK